MPQIYQRRSAHSDPAFRADRIGRLERQLASIAAVVQEKAGGHATAASSPSVNLSTTAENVVENHPMEGPATTPPAHLRFLFDNSLIAPSNRLGDTSTITERPPCSQKYLDHARARLQILMPPKEDVRATANYGTAWMLLHQSLFASALQFGSSRAMIDRYDDQLLPNAQPVDIASFLLAFAITVRQVPAEQQMLTLGGMYSFSLINDDVTMLMS